MLDARNRAEHHRDLAEECRHLATITLSSQMKKRYLLMAKDCVLLADIEEQEGIRLAYCNSPDDGCGKMPRALASLP